MTKLKDKDEKMKKKKADLDITVKIERVEKLYYADAGHLESYIVANDFGDAEQMFKERVGDDVEIKSIKFVSENVIAK